MKTQTKQRLILSDIKLILIAILIGLTYQQCTQSVANENDETSTSKIPVRIATEEIKTLVQPIQVTGIVSATEELRLSFKTGGIIDHIFVNGGDSVLKGQTLATLKLNEIQAQVNQAELSLEKASRDFERIKNLFHDSVATLEQFQNVTSALDLARSNFEIAQYNLKYSKITAPANGKVLMKLNENNELVNAGMPVLILATNNENWQIKTGLTDKEVVQIKIMDEASVQLDAFPNRTINGTVCQIGDAPDPQTGLYQVKLSLEKNEMQLKPGFFAQTLIRPSNPQAYVVIPVDAVSEGIGNTVTYYTLSTDRKKAVKKTAKIAWISDQYVVLDTHEKVVQPIIINSQKELKHLANVEIQHSNR